MRTHIRIYLIFVGILCLATFTTNGVGTTNASGTHMLEALRLLDGKPIEYLVRGPGYTLSIILSFLIFGPSTEAAYLVTRVFWAADIFLLFFLVNRLFGAREGFLAVLLALFSKPVVVALSCVTLDPILPAWIMASMILTLYGEDKESSILFMLAGLVLGLGFLFKELALLYLSFPLLLLLATSRKPEFSSFKWLLLFGIGFIVPLSSWFIYVYARTGDPFLFLGSAHPELVRTMEGTPSFSGYLFQVFILGLPQNIWTYITRYLLGRFWIMGYLICAAWLYHIYHAIRCRGGSSLKLIYMVLPFIPILVLAGYRGDRDGQHLIFHLLSFAALATPLIAYGNIALSKALKLIGKRGVTILAVSCLVIFIAVAVTARQRIHRILISPHMYSWHGPFGFKTIERLPRFSQKTEEASKWLMNNAEPGARVFVDGVSDQAIKFYTRFQFQYAGFTHYITSSQIERETLKGIANGSDRILYLIAYRNLTSPFKRYRNVQFYLERNLLDILRSAEPNRYLMISPRFFFFRSYFDSSPWAESIFVNEEISIYRISGPVDPFPFNGQTNISAEKLNAFASQFPDEYQELIDMLESAGVRFDSLHNTF